MFEVEWQNYVDHVVSFQHRMGMSNEKMADELFLSKRTYDRLAAGEHILNEFKLIMRVYQLSGKMMFEMTGAKVPREAEDLQTYLLLNDRNKDIIDKMLRVLYDQQCIEERNSSKHITSERR